MKKLRLGRFDRLVLMILAGLALTLAGVLLAAAQRGLKSPDLVNAAVGMNGPVGLVFSQKMQVDTVQNRLSFDPPLPGKLTWDGKILWFWPETALQPGLAYSLRLAPGAAAEDGQEIKAETRLAFQARPLRVMYLSPAQNGSEIWISAPDGSGQTQLTHSGSQVVDFGVAYDGNQVAFSATNTQQGSDLWTVQGDGNQARKVLDCGGDSCTQPAWSPDGKRIAYSRIRFSVAPGETFNSTPRIWTIDMETLKTAALFQDPATSGITPAWSPDGQHLAFYSPATKVIHVLNISTGKDLLLRSQSGVVGAWTSDSALLFYGDLQSSGSLPYGSGYVADIRTDVVTALFSAAPDAAPDINPPYPAPDGSWVVVGVKNRGGSNSVQLLKMKPDGSDPQEITHDHLYTHGAYRIDPAGNAVVYQRFLLGSSAAKPEVWIWEKGTGLSHRVAANATRPAWLP